MWFGRFLLWFFKPLAWLLFPFKTIGRENIPDTPGQPPLVLCCNQISVIDPVFLEMCQKRHVYFMAKEEIFKNRLATWFFAKQLGAFPVKRGAGDTAALDTLPEREISNGLAECIKHAVIADAEMLPLTRLPVADYVELAARNIAVKERFVSQDERDTTQRQFLNFGHTAGHAIEALSGYQLRHGECVAIGMVLAARIAQGLGVCAPDVPAAIIQALNAARLPIHCPYGPDALCDFVMHDKKRRGDEITWVLPERLGQCRLVPLPVDRLPALLRMGLTA